MAYVSIESDEVSCPMSMPLDHCPHVISAWKRDPKVSSFNVCLNMPHRLLLCLKTFSLDSVSWI